MPRNETIIFGRAAEDKAAQLLEEKGFKVTNMNDVKSNHPVYDLEATKNNTKIRISVKAARKKREIRLGSVKSLSKIQDGDLVMMFLPAEKGKDIDFENDKDGYTLLLVPGKVARDEGIRVHEHYCNSHPGSISHSVMVKDKVDRTKGTISGAAFKCWAAKYDSKCKCNWPKI